MTTPAHDPVTPRGARASRQDWLAPVGDITEEVFNDLETQLARILRTTRGLDRLKIIHRNRLGANGRAEFILDRDAHDQVALVEEAIQQRLGYPWGTAVIGRYDYRSGGMPDPGPAVVVFREPLDVPERKSLKERSLTTGLSTFAAFLCLLLVYVTWARYAA